MVDFGGGDGGGGRVIVMLVVMLAKEGRAGLICVLVGHVTVENFGWILSTFQEVNAKFNLS